MDLRILIVDDEATNRQVLDQAVRAFGHTTTLARDGPEALALLAAGRFDAVLLDLHMPQLSGLDVLERMRAEPGPNQDTAAVCVTADVLSRRPDEYLDLGFQAFLAKPVQIAKLAAVIDRVTAASIEDQRQQRTVAKLAALRRRMDARPPQ
ncbi:MAG: response regulator [Phenylobacterium sp.]|jgi:CheY-like chemotaxis protein|uniref:response regulator n=1 Tax=Phenylobacterium sp. TaxID=1871053 RepID=UPI002A36897E|nr:response regulator [Phenylobacterium sp.]MDX9998563.1 response regulator [Phenylobacterium sp.]